MNFKDVVAHYVELSDRSYLPVTAVIEDYIDEAELIEDEITDTGRWDIHRTAIYKHDGRFWGVDYSEPATENQDYELDNYSAYEVEPYEVTVTKYRAVRQ